MDIFVFSEACPVIALSSLEDVFTMLTRELIHNATRESTKAPVKVVPAKVEGTHCPVPLPVQKTSDFLAT